MTYGSFCNRSVSLIIRFGRGAAIVVAQLFAGLAEVGGLARELGGRLRIALECLIARYQMDQSGLH